MKTSKAFTDTILTYVVPQIAKYIIYNVPATYMITASSVLQNFRKTWKHH